MWGNGVALRRYVGERVLTVGIIGVKGNPWQIFSLCASDILITGHDPEFGLCEQRIMCNGFMKTDQKGDGFGLCII